MPDSIARSDGVRATPHGRAAPADPATRAAPRRRAARRKTQASPLDVQLATMNALYDASRDETGCIVRLDLARQACDIAKLAAPYLHARIGPAEAPPENGRARHEDVLDLLD